LEIHVEAVVERLWRCLEDLDGANLNAIIVTVSRCTYRPRSTECRDSLERHDASDIRYALGGHNRANLEAVIM
jgi:hypothetical protein